MIRSSELLLHWTFWEVYAYYWTVDLYTLYPATEGRQTGDNSVADTGYNVDGDKWIQVDTTCIPAMHPGVNAALERMHGRSFAALLAVETDRISRGAQWRAVTSVCECVWALSRSVL